MLEKALKVTWGLVAIMFIMLTAFCVIATIIEVRRWLIATDGNSFGLVRATCFALATFPLGFLADRAVRCRER